MSSRPVNRKKSRKRRLELTGKPLRRRKKRRMKRMFLGADHAFEERNQDCSEELSTLFRGISGGRRIHDPGEWIHNVKHRMYRCFPDTFAMGEDQFII